MIRGLGCVWESDHVFLSASRWKVIPSVMSCCTSSKYRPPLRDLEGRERKLPIRPCDCSYTTRYSITETPLVHLLQVPAFHRISIHIILPKIGVEECRKARFVVGSNVLTFACKRRPAVLIAVLKEAKRTRTRVALTPDAVKTLTGKGFEVAVESSAGMRLAPAMRIPGCGCEHLDRSHAAHRLGGRFSSGERTARPWIRSR